MKRHFHPLQTLLLILALAATAIVGLRPAYAAQPVDEQAHSALESLYAGAPGARASR